jgi:hypothetical protein
MLSWLEERPICRSSASDFPIKGIGETLQNKRVSCGGDHQLAAEAFAFLIVPLVMV